MRLLIVGGVAGGASAAARARRLSEDAEIILFERGPYISFANCGLPYHIGGVIQDRDRLLIQTPESMRARFNIDVRINTDVIKIDRSHKHLLTRDLITGTERKEPYDALILSPGAEPLRPPLPGMASAKICTLRNMADMDRIKKMLDLGPIRQAVVIGGGYIGLEMAEALRERNIEVTLVELKDQVMEPLDPEMAAFLHQEILLRGVDLRLGTAVKGFSEHDGKLYLELSTGESMPCDLAILAVGVKPENSLAKEAGLQIGERGGIVVDSSLRTNDPLIYAVGDAIEVQDFITGLKACVPLAGPANRQGRIAADVIFGKKSSYTATQGTAICKVFGLAAGMTGANEKQLKRRGLPLEKIYIHPGDHAGYYPGATPLHMKLLFDPITGRILGAQAVGAQGVDKRIDVLAVALRAGLTVNDLKDMELCYAPPYGSAKDPVNYLGFSASNVLDGTCRVCHVDDMLHPQPEQEILDVRTIEEAQLGKISGAMNIPVDDLRARWQELPKSKELLVYCKVGLRGYLACRILAQHGFNCRNLSGGYVTYEAQQGLGRKLNNAPVKLKDATGAVPVDHAIKEIPGVIHTIDACGLQCPGPILRMKQAIDLAAPGEKLEITAADPGFSSDVRAWCQSTGHELCDLRMNGNRITAVIVKQDHCAVHTPPEGQKAKTIVVFSSDFDKLMAAFIIANGAAAMGSRVTLFFTFWGLNALRRSEHVPVRKNLIEHMFGWMMPRGADKLSLSQMHMAGAGTWMIKAIMKHKHVSSLPELIAAARQSGIRLVACTMSMDLMGIKKEELIDGVEEGGVAMYLQNAEQGNVNLFI